MRDDPPVVVLVTHAAGNDQQAWDEPVERYEPPIWTMLIGPQRARGLERLRQSPALTTFGESKFSASRPGGGYGA
jgi:hypothetical protein